MKRLLITGHRGLLGSACCRRLKDKHEIVVFEGDITDESLFRCWFNQHRPEGVVHCAAKVGGVKSNREYPDDFLRVNLEIQRNVFNACVDFDVKRLVFVGTSCLYPKHAPLPVVEESLLTGPFEPDVEAYAVAKLAGYEFCKAQYDQHGRNYSTVAPCNLYGLGDNYGPSAHVIPALIARVHDCLQTGSPLVVWGDGSAIREFLFADDAADAIGYVLEGWNKPDIVNIGSSIGTSIQTLVKTILRVSGADLEVVWDTSKPVGIERKTFSTRKIQKLGWGPLVSLEVGLKKTWEDYINCKNVRSK